MRFEEFGYRLRCGGVIYEAAAAPALDIRGDCLRVSVRGFMINGTHETTNLHHRRRTKPQWGATDINLSNEIMAVPSEMILLSDGCGTNNNASLQKRWRAYSAKTRWADLLTGGSAPDDSALWSTRGRREQDSKVTDFQQVHDHPLVPIPLGSMYFVVGRASRPPTRYGLWGVIV